MEIISKFYLSLFTLKQASRRSWRIGQQQAVKVIFMAYADTPQHKALELIGAKVAAANSLEGRLSGDDDLSAMGEDEDNIQLALARSILNGDSASRDIKTTTIKNFGDDRDFDAFELYYQSLLDERDMQEQIKAKTVEAEAKNEEKEISTHESSSEDSKGYSLFDIVSQSSNISICSMPKQTQPKTRVENMIEQFAKQLFEDHKSGDLYGGIKSDTCLSMRGAYPLFEIDDDYRDGKQYGLIASYNRDKEKNVDKINIERVYFEDNVPYQTDKTVMYFSKNVLHTILQEANSTSSLAKVLTAHFEAKSITDKSLKRDIKDEADEVKYVAIIGKGKKAKKVEVSPANNLFDAIPETEKAHGVQLAFAF